MNDPDLRDCLMSKLSAVWAWIISVGGAASIAAQLQSWLSIAATLVGLILTVFLIRSNAALTKARILESQKLQLEIDAMKRESK